MVLIEHMFYTGRPLSAGFDRSDPWRRPRTPNSTATPTSRSSTARPRPDDLVERAVELGLTGLAVTDHDGLYGAVRFVDARPRRRAPPGRRCRDRAARSGRRGPGRDRRPAAPARRRGGRRGGRTRAAAVRTPAARRRPRACPPGPGRRAPGCPAIASRSRRTCAGSASGSAGRTSSCSPDRRSAGGACAGSCRGRTWPGRRPCRGSARRSSPSTPRGSSRCRAAATASWPGACGRATGRARGPSRNATRRSSGGATARPRAASSSSCRTTSCPTTTGSWRRRRRWPRTLGLPVVVTNDVHYARPEDRELADVLTAIRHGRTLDTLGDLRRADGESYLKSGAELAALPPARRRRSPARREPGRRGSSTAVGARGVVLGRSRLRAVPLPGLPGAGRRDAVLVPRRSCAGRAPGGATTR